MQDTSFIIKSCRYGYIREPLKSAFGFKGASVGELWQVVCQIQLENGTFGTGVGVQSVLWSDAEVFRSCTPREGNERMLRTTAFALQRLKGLRFTNPPSLQKEILGDVRDYARRITGKQNLSETFVLNALVAVDFALWQIEARLCGVSDAGELLRSWCPALTEREPLLGAIPLLSYNCGEADIRALLDDGAFFLKIKIGSDPGGDGDRMKMIQWDTERVNAIHRLASGYETPYTDCGRPVYYLDANGRYQTRRELEEFLNGIRDSGALDRVILLEEPFAEDNLQTVRDLPVLVAGDESAHSAGDAVRLIRDYGYGAIALKPIAKTMSATLETLTAASAEGAVCFCADLTVPPIMLDWNMQVAARLKRLPGLRCGVVESNGSQNYCSWASFYDRLPIPGASWLHSSRGVFRLGEGFYSAAMALRPIPAYEAAALTQVYDEGKKGGSQ